MWTSTIIKKERKNDTAQIDVRFSDGTNSFEQPFFVSDVDEFNNAVQAKLGKLESLDKLVADSKVDTGVYDSTPVISSVDDPNP